MTGEPEKDMVIYLSGKHRRSAPEPLPSFDELTPREIVAELDKYIVGQNAAKRAVAVALRNRVRWRKKLQPEMAEDVLPKNILMIGPTGVGKTEIARRLARLAGCPFVKVEASKYTEVGYVGRDVESMVRDLVETGIDMVREKRSSTKWPSGRNNPRKSGCSIFCFRQRCLRTIRQACRPKLRAASKRSGPGTSCGHNCAKASSTSAWWKWKCASGPCLHLKL